MTTLDTLTHIIAAKLDASPEGIKPSTRFREDMGTDDLTLWEIIDATEQTYDFESSDAEQDLLKTVGDLVALVEMKTGVEA